MITEFVPTIAVDGLAEGTMVGVTAEGESVLLARIGGEIFAISDICSHFRTHLSQGELLPERCQVQCPLHDSCFDLRTGEPLEPPAEDPVRTFAVQVRGGMIHVGPR